MKLILASASPRRAEILRNAGVPFEIHHANIDETALPGESAEDLVARLAEAKARSVAASLEGDSSVRIVLGADTAVEIAGEILGKPRDASDACRMLGVLSGRTHQVLTGVFLLRFPDGASRAAIETSAVRFTRLEDAEIRAYVASGEPFGKAGGYAIQGLAGKLIPGIEGCYFNVVGLPLARVYVLLHELGWSQEA